MAIDRVVAFLNPIELDENHLGPLTQLQTTQLEQTWKNISATSREHKKLNHEIYLLMRNFNGQQVPGGLLGLNKEVVLPTFTNVYEDYHLNSKSDGNIVNRFTLDIFAQGKEFLLWIEGVEGG